MGFESSAYFLAVFLIGTAALLMLIAFRLERTSSKKSGVFSFHNALVVFAVAYAIIGLFSVLVGLGYAVENTNLAPCENVISYENATVENYVYYTYVDSCASRTTPQSIEMIYVAYSYLLYATIMVSVVALLILSLREIMFKW